MTTKIRASLWVSMFLLSSMFLADAAMSSELDVAPVFSGRFVMLSSNVVPFPYVFDETSPIGAALMESSNLLLTFRPLRERSIEPTLADLAGRAIPYVDAKGQQCMARLGKLHALEYFELPYFQERLEHYFPEVGEIGLDWDKGRRLLARISTEQVLLRQLYRDENLNSNTNTRRSSSLTGFELTDLDSRCGEPMVAGFAIKAAAFSKRALKSETSRGERWFSAPFACASAAASPCQPFKASCSRTAWPAVPKSA